MYVCGHCTATSIDMQTYIYGPDCSSFFSHKAGKRSLCPLASHVWTCLLMPSHLQDKAASVLWHCKHRWMLLSLPSYLHLVHLHASKSRCLAAGHQSAEPRVPAVCHSCSGGGSCPHPGGSCAAPARNQSCSLALLCNCRWGLKYLALKVPLST